MLVGANALFSRPKVFQSAVNSLLKIEKKKNDTRSSANSLALDYNL